MADWGLTLIGLLKPFFMPVPNELISVKITLLYFTKHTLPANTF